MYFILFIESLIFTFLIIVIMKLTAKLYYYSNFQLNLKYESLSIINTILNIHNKFNSDKNFDIRKDTLNTGVSPFKLWIPVRIPRQLRT